MDTTATIIEKRPLTEVTTLFVVSAPLVAHNAAAGQFVIVRVTELGERVPVSLTDFDPAAGTITLVVQRVGRTSALIGALEEGETILDLAGPLGHPVDLPHTGHVVLIGGGFGTGAIFPLARELRRRSVRVSAIVGARTSGLVILRDLLEPVCDEYLVCTDDGSLGYHGVVTGLLADRLAEGAAYTQGYAVGPMAMMRAVAVTAGQWRLPAMVSLDPVMIDGTGMCGGCRVSVGGVTRFACIDGPFFDAAGIDFDEAVARKAMYAEQERAACELAGVAV
ncbi:MAG: sulfide/dihydroorotate dehydrogenase-like FAD/NAD-binding protein [Gaiellaceae bacterium]